MENNERDRKLHQWLDDALSNYSAAEPRYGLEQRIISRVRAEEMVRARRWNLWRWMPAFGAIAAIVVIAVAIRPVIEKKSTQREMSSQVSTYYSAQDQKSSAGIPAGSGESAAPNLSKKMAETRKSPRTDQTLRRELALSPTPVSRDRTQKTAESAKQDQGTVPHDWKNDPASGNDMVAEAIESRPGAAAPHVAPPPPPPPPPAESSNAVNRLGAERMRMSISPALSQSDEQLQRNAGMVQAEIPGVGEEKPRQSTIPMDKDSRRMEAHAKPENSREDDNGMDVFGVRVRFETGPSTSAKQFPTPVPLSRQEKLAIAAGHQLKDEAVAHKAGDKVRDIEIKPIEIKPLEGPEK